MKGFDPIVGVALQLGELFGVRAARRFPFGPSGVVDLAVGLVEIAAQPSCCVAFSVRGGLGGGFAGQKISFLAVACARSAWSSASQSPHSVAAARRSASVSSSRYCRRRDDETINETKRNYETKRNETPWRQSWARVGGQCQFSREVANSQGSGETVASSHRSGERWTGAGGF
nr:hypothetical protein [Mycobacterium sp.]